MDNDARKRYTALILALLLLGGAVLSFAGCDLRPDPPVSAGPDLPEEVAVSANEPLKLEDLRTDDANPTLRALVLYADDNPATEEDETASGHGKEGAGADPGWMAAYTQLSRSLAVNLEADAKGVFALAAGSKEPVWSDTHRPLADALAEQLAGYDLIDLDPSLTADRTLWANVEPALKEWVKGGGFLFVANASVPAIDQYFLGIENYKKLNSCPTDWTLPEVRGNLAGLRDVLADYLTLFKSYRNSKDYKNCDFGYVLTPRTAVPLVSIDAGSQHLVLPGSETESFYAIVSELPDDAAVGPATERAAVPVKEGTFALSCVNRWGSGFVLTASGLLPNEFTVTSYTLSQATAERDTFIETTASACQLFRSAFASFASKERFGYAIERLFGSDGQPSIAWQLHYEEQTGIANGSAVLFADLAERYGQIPSYTLVRNPYTWFRSAAAVSYVLGRRDESGRIFFEPDAYENAYDSGTRFIDEGTGEYLTFDTADTGSYFTPNPWDDSAGCTVDVAVKKAADGRLLFLFRTPDAKVYTSFGRGFRDGNYVVTSPVYLDPMRFDSATGYETMTRPFLVMDAASNEVRAFLGTRFGRQDIGEWSRTATADLDGDGLDETVIGNRDGYLGVYTAYLERPVDSVHKWRFDGRLGSSFGNAFGNTDLKFGEYACPAFADLNGDGIIDLIVGHREYGLAYPADSPYFPEADALKAQIDELKARGYYIGAHVKTTVDATSAQERTELELHKKALVAYGLPTEGIGANHHTWVTSNRSLTQTFRNEWDAGFLWDSGWKAANNTVSPENNAENVWSLPFFLANGEGGETILLFNTATVGYDGNGWSALTAKYELPVSVYYHCDLAYLDPAGTETFVRNVGAFAERYGYRWVSEATLAKEIAAAYNVTAEAAMLTDRPTEILTLSSGDPTETKAEAERHKGEYSLRIRLGEKDRDKPLYDAEVQSRASVRVLPSELFDETPIRLTSPLPGETTSLHATLFLK